MWYEYFLYVLLDGLMRKDTISQRRALKSHEFDEEKNEEFWISHLISRCLSLRTYTIPFEMIFVTME